MASDIFEEVRADHPGYFEVGREEDFPWNYKESSVWYALIGFSEGEIQRVGYTSSKSAKIMLIEALIRIKNPKEFILLGVWNGERRTNLFILEPKKAIEYLRKEVGYT